MRAGEVIMLPSVQKRLRGRDERPQQPYKLRCWIWKETSRLERRQLWMDYIVLFGGQAYAAELLYPRRSPYSDWRTTRGAVTYSRAFDRYWLRGWDSAVGQAEELPDSTYPDQEGD